MKNKYKVVPILNVVIIYLDREDGSQEITVIDLEDLGPVLSYSGRWHAINHKSTGLTYARGGDHYYGNRPLLHRYIMNPHRGQNTSHYNGNGLDCRRKNLCNVLIGETARGSRKVSNILSKLTWLYLKIRN